MKKTLLVLGFIAAFARAEEVIPDYVEYSAPEPFFRAHSVKGAAPAPEFYHPKNGGSQLWAAFKFAFVPVGWSIGQGKVVTFRPLSWDELKTLALDIYPDPLHAEKKVLSEKSIDGRKVLILDYEVPQQRSYPIARLYFSRLWIRVEENKVLEGQIACSTEELRRVLRDSLGTIRIHRYYEK